VTPAARGLLLPLALLSCLAAPVLMLAGAHSPVRLAAAVGLFGLAPGVAILPWGRTAGAAADVALVVATSLAVSTLAAEVMLWSHAWSPTAGACVLAGASALAMVVRLGRRRGGAT
jgi:hypothetical protein